MPIQNEKPITEAQLRRVARYCAKQYAKTGSTLAGADRMKKDLRITPSKIWECLEELERRGYVCSIHRINLDGIPSNEKCHHWSCHNAECEAAWRSFGETGEMTPQIRAQGLTERNRPIFGIGRTTVKTSR